MTEAKRVAAALVRHTLQLVAFAVAGLALAGALLVIDRAVAVALLVAGAAVLATRS
jgi:hypothetical protein